MRSTIGDYRRILVCDDEPGVIDAYQRIFSDLVECNKDDNDAALDALAADLFGDGLSSDAIGGGINEIIYRHQGEDAVAAFEQAGREGAPFAAVFLDVRMPPGIDGVETARRMRAIDPRVNIVIVTGYSDHRPAAIAGLVGAQDRLFYLVKPFDADEVRQMATTLANRWSSDRRTAVELASRLQELEEANRALRASEASAHLGARRDALTGLLNRKGLHEAFEATLSLAREGGREVSFAYIDLDRFKQVNDAHGHAVGDRLLCEVANRIVQAAGDDCFVGRLGGDEFAVFSAKSETFEDVVGRLLRVAEKQFEEDGFRLPVSLSVGYCHCSARDCDLSDAMRRADVALYSAKMAGRGVASIYDHQMAEQFQRSQAMARDLRDAIDEELLQLHYQPLMSADGLRVTGLEALLRWDRPGHGAVSPAVFVPIAEQSKLMIALGDWVLRRAITDVRFWPDVVTSINLSSIQLSQPNFAGYVIGLVSAAGISPAMIEFEITETALSANMTNFAEQVEQLRQAGFKLALDDFGSGYASIGYLSQLRFNKLKIDRSLVSNLRHKPNADSMIRSIVGIGEAMGLTVTAEGVEEEFQHEALRTAGCEQMQGFLFHRPCTRQDVEKLLDRQRQADRAA